jgi:DNA-binding HxlR family transcriptional regulator
MSRNLLAYRLDALRHAGIIDRKVAANGRGHEYFLTSAGQEFRSVVDALGN